MKNRKMLLALAAASAAVLTVALVIYVRWVVDFTLHWSDDLNANALHMLGMTIPLAVVSLLEGLVIRDVWHFVKGREQDDDLELPGEREKSSKERIRREVRRQVRETWTVWGAFIGIPLVLNVLLINWASGGYILSGQGGLSRYATVATMLRSPDPDVRHEGIFESVGLTERSLGVYLARIIAERGPQAEYAAWAAGTRGDEQAVVPLRWLFLEGDEEQRATAIISLARLGDRRGAELALMSARRAEEPQLESILALGLTAHQPAEDDLVELAADEDHPEVLRAAAMWAIGQIEQERFNEAFYAQRAGGLPLSEMQQPERRGHGPMLDALDGDSDVLRCAAVQSLGYSGPVESAQDLIDVFERSGHLDKCPSLAIVQHDVTRVDFVRSGLIRSHIINALAKIGNRRIVGWLEEQAEDRDNADEVILKARDLARQIRKL
jgi:HEAT repeat protein